MIFDIDHPTANRIPMSATFKNAADNFSSCHFTVKIINANKKCRKNMNAIIIDLVRDVSGLPVDKRHSY